MIRDTLRTTVLSAENTRITVSTMRAQHVFDDAGLRADIAGTADFRKTRMYSTVPVVAAWNSIEDIANKEGYTFRVPARRPRNPKNQPSSDEERILGLIETEKLPEYFAEDSAAGELVYARPIVLGADCLLCHGDPASSPTHNGKDLLGFPMEGWHVGDQHGMFLLRSKLDKVDAVVEAGMLRTLCWLLPLSICVGLCVYLMISRITRNLQDLTRAIADSSEQVTDAAGQIAASSNALAHGATDQAASLQETSAAIGQITSMTRRNTDSSSRAAEEVDQVNRHIGTSQAKLDELISSMKEIGDASGRIASIIKVIDEISFQTNILALNAAVEASRAGQAGSGFAVVADEVRSLAQRSAQAAKDTTVLIEESLGKSQTGSAKLQDVIGVFQSITASAARLKVLVDEVHGGSKEQSRGIEQVLNSIRKMNQLTQNSAASAEQSAATSQELSGQAETMNQIAHELRRVIQG